MFQCPRCGRPGSEVEKITVAAHANESSWPLGDERFFHCPSPGCEVIYFTASGDRLLTRADVKTRVTFKEMTAPRPLCYCKQVTEEDVIAAIEKGAASFEEVQEATGIGGGGHCAITNPAGRCCARNYRPFIVNELAKRVGTQDPPRTPKLRRRR
ncbi:MAG: (2Fe-2S)-binding protein [Methanomassiliicoccales archaeon]